MSLKVLDFDAVKSDKELNLLNFIESGRLSIAAQQISKNIKKEPKDVFLKSLLAYVFFLQRKKDDCFKQAEEIIQAVPTDIKAINLLNNLLIVSGNEVLLVKMYDTLIKRYPRYEAFQYLYFVNMKNTLNVRLMQKAAISLYNNFKKRNYGLLASLLCAMIVTYPFTQATELDKRLFPSLGLKIINSLAPLQSTEEVYIRCILLALSGKHEDVYSTTMDYLAGQSDKFNLALQCITIEKLNEGKKWEQLNKFALFSISDNKQDDWALLDSLIISAFELDKEIGSNNYENQLKTIVNKEGAEKNRNHLLADIKYNLVFNKPWEEISSSIQRYFSVFGSRLCAFDDLKTFLGSFPDRIPRESFLQYLVAQFHSIDPETCSLSDLIKLVNVQRLRFLICDDLALNLQFAEENVKLYDQTKRLLKEKEVTDYHPGDFFILIAVNIFLTVDSSFTTVLKCILLLEHACQGSQHEYSTRLWLIALYSYLGCAIQSQVIYEHLSVKNIQHDIMSYLVTTRLATVSPHVKILQKQLAFYQETIPSSMGFLQLAMEDQKYTQVPSMLEFTERITHSLTRGLLLLESSRTAAILRLKNTVETKDFDINYGHVKGFWKDNRSFKSLFRRGFEEENPLYFEKISVGPKQTDKYMTLFTLRSRILDSLAENPCKEDLDSLEELLSDQAVVEELTEAEIWSCNCVKALLRSALKRSDPTRYGEVLKLLKSIDDVLIQPNELATWQTFHAVFTVIEMLHFVATNMMKLQANRAQLKPHLPSVEALKNEAIEKGTWIRSTYVQSARQYNELQINSYKISLNDWCSAVHIDPTVLDTVVDRIKLAHYNTWATARST